MPSLQNETGGILKFSSKVDNLVCIMKSLGQEVYLKHPELLEEFLRKLEIDLRRRWSDYFKIQKPGFLLEVF